MTTIVTKNGSGAPLASDLVQGELAVDLTNKRLYTEDSGGTVIEVGTSPSTIDINAGTIDGTVIGGASAAAGTFTTFTSTGIDDNATSTAITIDSSQNVGIGTASPSSYANDNALAVVGSSNGVISVASFAGSPGIFFRDSDSPATQKGYVQYDVASNWLRFATDGAERMRIDSSGNVGIGTSSPSEKLEISANTGATLKITSTDEGLLTGEVIGSIKFESNDASGTPPHISGEISVIAEDDFGRGAMAFSTGRTGDFQEAMRIDSSGNVGINTSSPATSLHVKNSADCTLLLQSGDGNTAEILFGDASDTSRGKIKYLSSDQMTFEVNNLSEAMRIDSSGRFLIGKTTGTGAELVSSGAGFAFVPTGTGNGFATMVGTVGTNSLLYLNQRNFNSSNPLIIFYSNDGSTSNSVVGSITHNGSTTSYNTSSDERLKENIVDAPAGNIDAIRVRSFDWKADGSHQTYGMVAQELVDVAPEAVSQGATEDDMWGVDYSKLVPMMIKEIQDLKAEVAALKGA